MIDLAKLLKDYQAEILSADVAYAYTGFAHSAQFDLRQAYQNALKGLQAMCGKDLANVLRDVAWETIDTIHSSEDPVQASKDWLKSAKKN